MNLVTVMGIQDSGCILCSVGLTIACCSLDMFWCSIRLLLIINPMFLSALETVVNVLGHCILPDDNSKILIAIKDRGVFIVLGVCVACL